MAAYVLGSTTSTPNYTAPRDVTAPCVTSPNRPVPRSRSLAEQHRHVRTPPPRNPPARNLRHRVDTRATVVPNTKITDFTTH